MRTLLIEPHYLPCIEYFTMIGMVENVLIESHEYYVKQTYRNRCKVLTSQGPFELFVPISKKRGKDLMKDVRIDYHQKWVKDHWRTIKTAYGNAPYFEHFGFMIEQVLTKRWEFLLDLNLELISICTKLLQLNIRYRLTSEYTGTYESAIIDWRSKIQAKKALENNPFYKPCNYNQIFGKKFVGNLSIIDLLFCEGPLARQVVLNSKP